MLKIKTWKLKKKKKKKKKNKKLKIKKKKKEKWTNQSTVNLLEREGERDLWGYPPN